MRSEVELRRNLLELTEKGISEYSGSESLLLLDSGELGFRKLPEEDRKTKSLDFRMFFERVNCSLEFSGDAYQRGNSGNSRLGSHIRDRSLESAGWCTRRSNCILSLNCLRKQNYFIISSSGKLVLLTMDWV